MKIADRNYLHHSDSPNVSLKLNVHLSHLGMQKQRFLLTIIMANGLICKADETVMQRNPEGYPTTI